ncbi:MAG: SURF1 family protein, partial [Pseudomonadota bacterium]|nr:SURF1 family protein [Pseudomonadota bacterium]
MRRTLPLLATVVMLAGLLSLGFWQVERLAWKEDLLARIEQRLSAESLVLASADDIASLRREAHDYHPAVIDATRSGGSVLWFTQIENAPAGIAPADRVGYHVLTPVVLADGAHILLDEGFVPARLKDQIGDLQGKVQRLPVVIRWPDARNIFAAENDLENGLAYVRDAPQ